jgi:nitrogen fixation NifU-like protein
MSVLEKLYSKKVMDHFFHPRNMGEIKNADAVGKAGNPVCGDVMYLYIKVKKDSKGRAVIEDIKFQTMGCAAAIATSSVITELAKGKTLEEAEKITMKDVADALDGLPPVKMHCSNLSAEALHNAIKEYKKKHST